MVIDCDVNGTKLAVRAAWNHQHNAFKSQNVFIFFFFRNSLTTWDFLQSHRMFFVQNTDSSSRFNAIWQKKIPCNWQYWETCCVKPCLYCFWILLNHVVHYNIISKLRIAWHNKLLVYTSCIWDKIEFYHYPSSIKYWLVLNS